jgi:hypothetical protein
VVNARKLGSYPEEWNLWASVPRNGKWMTAPSVLVQTTSCDDPGRPRDCRMLICARAPAVAVASSQEKRGCS